MINFEFIGQYDVSRIKDNQDLHKAIIFYSNSPQLLEKTNHWVGFNRGVDARHSKNVQKDIEKWLSEDASILLLWETDACALETVAIDHWVRIDLFSKIIEIKDPERPFLIQKEVIIPRIQFY